ncbi:hypothetical protein [Microbacterium sp.]
MAIAVGTLTTRVLIVVGDGEPVEVVTLPTKLTAARPGPGVVLNSRRWCLSLAFGFLRIAWATATMRAR